MLFSGKISHYVSILRGTADWFGVSKDSGSTQRWRRRSLQHCSQLYGGLKTQVMRDMELHSHDNLSLASTETPPPLYLMPQHPNHHHHPCGMQRVGQRLVVGWWVVTAEGRRNKPVFILSHFSPSPFHLGFDALHFMYALSSHLGCFFFLCSFENVFGSFNITNFHLKCYS